MSTNLIEQIKQNRADKPRDKPAAPEGTVSVQGYCHAHKLSDEKQKGQSWVGRIAGVSIKEGEPEFKYEFQNPSWTEWLSDKKDGEISASEKTWFLKAGEVYKVALIEKEGGKHQYAFIKVVDSETVILDKDEAFEVVSSK